LKRILIKIIKNLEKIKKNMLKHLEKYRKKKLFNKILIKIMKTIIKKNLYLPTPIINKIQMKNLII